MSEQDSVRAINRQLEEKEVMARAKQLGMPYVDVAVAAINIDLLKLISEEDAVRGMLIPFFRVGKKIRLAVLDPDANNTKKVLDKLRAEGYLLNINLASESGIKESLLQYKSDLITKKQVIFDNEIVEDNLSAYEKEIENLTSLKEKLEKIDSAEALNTLLVGAVKTGASDLHFEPYEHDAKVRFRIDGVMQDIFTLDSAVMIEIIAQVKQKARLKLNITSEPQDGRLFFVVNERKIDVRVSSIPTVYGESIVMRLLDSGKRTLDLSELGFEGRSLEIIEASANHPNGVILSTGPTGSGKTTSLYALLGILNSPERKIITLEDPVEYHIDNVSQSQIDAGKDYTFAKGLRAILRQDPDVVMVGEIRDLETAEIASQAAMTGHIVLSTLHTNNAVAAIPRLVNMGLKPYMVGPALDVIIAQRLVRRLCPKCAKHEAVSEKLKPILKQEIDDIKKVTGKNYDMPTELLTAVGCDYCSHTGYHGQIGLFEVLDVDKEIERMIMQEKPSVDIYEYARKHGMTTLREDGVSKVLDGKTTMEEVLRVTADSE